MRILAIIIAAVAVMALPGCSATSQPLNKSHNPPLKPSSELVRLTVALLHSENSLALFNRARKMGTKAGWQEIGMLPVEFRKRFNRNFKSVKTIDRIEDASEVDVIAVWEADATVEKRQVRVSNSITFYDRNHQQIDALRGESAQELSAFHGRENAQRAIEESLNGLEDALRHSTKLATQVKAFRQEASPALTRPGVGSAPALPATIHSDIDRPSYKFREKENLFAVVIGIERYANIPEAEFAERDAEAVRAHLLALGYPLRNVIFLVGQQAVRSSIEKYLEAWLPRNLDVQSRLFFYFSGHGAPDTNSRTAYLMPWDGDAKFLENTAYSLKRLYEKLNALPAKEIIVAMDACFSGAGGRSVLAKGTRPLVSKVDTGVVAGKLVVLSASSSDEITGTDSGQGHGLFTYHFLKGLDGGVKGGVTVKALYDYLTPRVRDAARRENRDQTPQLMPTDAGGRGELLIKE